MATALRASCPSCKMKVSVSDSPDESGIATVTCTGCGKKFGLRFPNNDAPATKRKSPAVPARIETSPSNDPFANLSGSLPDPMSPANANWEDYRVRRKPLIAGKPLLIAIGATVGIICIVALGMVVSKKAAEIDMNAISDSLLKGPADTIEKIHADWNRFNDEQKALTASISRRSDCAEQIFTMERLEEKQLNLLIRGALLDQANATQIALKDLPPAQTMRPSDGKNFRSTEAFLTNEFREAEKKVNLQSNAVLGYLHTELKPLGSPANDVEKRFQKKVSIKRALCRALAEAHRGAGESETAVAIYELTEEQKKFQTAGEPSGTKIVSTLPAEYQYAEYTANQMQIALALRFTKDPHSEIAKALTAFDQAY